MNPLRYIPAILLAPLWLPLWLAGNRDGILGAIGAVLRGVLWAVLLVVEVALRFGVWVVEASQKRNSRT